MEVTINATLSSDQSGKRKLAGGLLATTLALTGGVAIVGAANGTPNHSEYGDVPLHGDHQFFGE